MSDVPTWPTPPRWMERALCLEVDNDAFYPEGQGMGSALARSICSRCEVRADCLAFAVEAREEFGIWGGLTPRQRRLMRRAA